MTRTSRSSAPTSVLPAAPLLAHPPLTSHRQPLAGPGPVRQAAQGDRERHQRGAEAREREDGCVSACHAHHRGCAALHFIPPRFMLKAAVRRRQGARDGSRASKPVGPRGRQAAHGRGAPAPGRALHKDHQAPRRRAAARARARTKAQRRRAGQVRHQRQADCKVCRRPRRPRRADRHRGGHARRVRPTLSYRACGSVCSSPLQSSPAGRRPPELTRPPSQRRPPGLQDHDPAAAQDRRVRHHDAGRGEARRDVPGRRRVQGADREAARGCREAAADGASVALSCLCSRPALARTAADSRVL